MIKGIPLLLAVSVSVLLSGPAVAQSASPDSAPRPSAVPGIRASMARVSFDDLKDRRAPVRPSGSRSNAVKSNSHRTEAKIAGAILGAVGGFFAGGMIGAQLEPNCRCDDPGLTGFIVGAPIGAVAGGIAGAILASR